MELRRRARGPVATLCREMQVDPIEKRPVEQRLRASFIPHAVRAGRIARTGMKERGDIGHPGRRRGFVNVPHQRFPAAALPCPSVA
jgi:hypothetical protein